MASGDATRVWFMEVEAILVARWRGGFFEPSPGTRPPSFVRPADVIIRILH